MGITTDFNVAPYYDDYNEDKNFHKVLFKPAVAVQARELTQLQSILQNQVERFGENILRQGSIVKGGNFVESNSLAYVKIRDLQSNGQPVIMSNYVNLYAQGQLTGVKAVVELTATGLESQAPDLNTLFVKYLGASTKVGQINKRVFQAGEIIDLYSDVDFNTLTAYSVTVATEEIDADPVGYCYSTKCSDGVVFQKGHFVRFDAQTTVVSKYGTEPDGLVVGFRTAESVINSGNDTSLLDNANGYNNFNAPGADRLKLTPILTTLTLAEAEADDTFFAIQEYDNGRLVRRSNTTQFNSVEKLLAQRTAEESGNYALQDYRIRVQQKASNTDLLEAACGAGVAYVEGNRIDILGEITVDMPKATTFQTTAQQDILANYGNYIIVSNYLGNFDFTQQQTVNLYTTVTAATSTSGLSAPTGLAGTAKVRSVTRDGTSNTNFRIYLFDIKMSTGQSFSDVKSIYDNDPAAVANLVLESGQAVLKDASFRNLIFPVGKKAIKSVASAGTDYIFRTKLSAVQFGIDGSTTITTETGTIFPYGASATLGSDARAEIMVIAEETRDEYNQGTSLAMSTATITTSSDEQTLTIQLADTSLSASLNTTVYVNIKDIDVLPIGKILKTVYIKFDTNTLGTDGTYSLGLPDVFSIEEITESANTDYTTSAVDVTNQYYLKKNDTEEYYGLSYIYKKRSFTPGASGRYVLVKAKVFEKSVTSGFSQSFFSVDSYPVDQDIATLPDNKIRLEDIPTFITNSGIILYLRDQIDFRPYGANTVAYATTSGTASVMTRSVATEKTNLSFGADSLNLIAPNKTLEVEYDYYLGRQDRFIIDETGNFTLIQGEPAEDPKAPSAPKLGMTLATFFIPPYPSLPSVIANIADKPDYGVKISIENHRRYTMDDIGKIEKRLNNIEYYTVLNALEKSANDLVITDAAGLNRFKNGILVDNFDTLQVANLKDTNFGAAVDPAESELMPRFRKYNIGLKVVPESKTNVTDFGEGITLSKTDKLVINQPYATSFRNCVTDFWKFSGVTNLFPEYDGAPEVVTAPAANISIDNTAMIQSLVETIGEFVPMTSVSAAVISQRSGSSIQVARDGRTTSTTTTITTDTTTKFTESGISVSAGKTSQQKVGDFVTDFNFQPFLRENVIRILSKGLRPNTRFYFFFDGVDVNNSVVPAIAGTTPAIAGIVRAGKFGNPYEIYSDSNGTLIAMFRVPADTFYVGDRTLTITDVDSLISIEAATSTTTAIYRGFNFSVEKTPLKVTTRETSISKTSTSWNNTETQVESNTVSVTSPLVIAPAAPPSVTAPVTAPRRRRSLFRRLFDPIAQTFPIETEMSSDVAIFATKINLYFKQKNDTLGITVQLRDTINGYPGPNIIPFASIHLESSQVNVSNNGSLATTITFDSPVALKTDTEYCVVTIPDQCNPDYLIWISKTGLVDVTTGKSVNSDTNGGTLFTSTNNTAWTPYQDENVKFQLYKAEFTSASGTYNMTNKDHEFFTLSSYAGKFQRGEGVFVNNNTNLAGTIATTTNSQTITGNGTAFTSTFAVGEHIVYKDGSYNQVLKVTKIISNTSMTVSEYPSTANNAGLYQKTVSGVVDYFNTNGDTIRLILENSSAKTGLIFANNDVIIGEDSGATGTIQTVDSLPISYLQPQFYRTNFTRTRSILRATQLSDGAVNYLGGTSSNIDFDDNKYFNGTATYIRSKSLAPTERSFVLTMDLFNTSTTTIDTSPFIDQQISTVDIYEHLINNDLTDENTINEGAAFSKYISKTVELADGLDADDIKVWLTAYKPAGSDITVYAKLKNSADSADFDQIPWTKLKLVGKNNFVSSNVNRFDFREFEYGMDTTGFQSDGTTVTPVATAAGSAVLEDNVTFKYLDETGAIYTNYKYFAVKIVMTSSGPNRIPRVRDMRTLALTV
jgi:hypothetical protein